MTKLAHTLHEQVIEGCAEKHAGVLFVAVDIAVLPLVITPLRSLHTRLPNQEMLLVCPVSRLDMQRPEQVQEVSAWLGKLQEDGIVATTLLVDANRSPMARKGDAATIEKAAMQTLFGLLIAQYSDESNPSLGEVLQQVGTQSPCMGLAYSAAQVVSGRTPLAWQVVKAVAPKVGDRGSGSMSDMLIQAVACTKQVFTDEATTASPQPLDAQKPCFVLFHLPYARGDKRFAETATSLSRFLHATYPQAQGIMVHGNGVALPTLEGKYRVGVSCLYPLTLPVSGHTEELTLDELRLEVPSEDVPLVKGNGRRKHEAVEK